jgi:hypothetical protein
VQVLHHSVKELATKRLGADVMAFAQVGKGWAGSALAGETAATLEACASQSGWSLLGAVQVAALVMTPVWTQWCSDTQVHGLQGSSAGR